MDVRRRYESGYLLCEWMAAMAIVIVFVSAISMPVLSAWQDRLAWNRSVQTVYWYMLRVQSHASLSGYGKENCYPSFTLNDGVLMQKAGMRSWKDSAVTLPPIIQRGNWCQLTFDKFGHDVEDRYNLTIVSPVCRRQAGFVVSLQTGRIRIDERRYR